MAATSGAILCQTGVSGLLLSTLQLIVNGEEHCYLTIY